MTFFEKLRDISFWTADMLKGGPIKTHYNDIQLINSNEEKAFANRTKKYLQDILSHAVRTTDYYRSFSTEEIIHFPVVNKNIIRESSDFFLSSKYNREELIPAVTSGSTGTPFKVFHDKNKKYRNTADTIYFARQGGYHIGNKLYYFKIWSDNNKKSNLKQFLENIVPVDVLNLKQNSSNVIADINTNKSPISFLGYVSALEELCKYLDKENILNPRVKVNSIITMSESLDEQTRASAKYYFKCPVLSRYSNIENGILAQQIIDNSTSFVVNKASYLIEILDFDSDKVLPYGKMGRIVVTDYFNYGMPMIRYDTGDMGVLNETVFNGKKQLLLTSIEGRKLDRIFNTQGEQISSYIIYKNMWQYTEIEQYQFIQAGPKDYIFKISLEGKFMKEDQLKREFVSYLGNDANFSIDYVEEIPLLNSGKRKKVVNLMEIN